MTRFRGITIRNKPIIPEVISSRACKALDRVVTRVGIRLPALFGKEMPAPPAIETIFVDSVDSGFVTDSFLGAIEGVEIPGVARFSDYASRVAETPQAPVGNGPSLLGKGLRLFMRPLDRLIGGLTMSAMPLLHFHGGDYSTKRIALPLTGQKVAGVVSIDWADIRSTISPKIEGIIARLIRTISENSTPNLAEIRIFLHSGKTTSALSLSREWTMVRGDQGKTYERRYALHTEKQILVIDLFGVTPETLEEYAQGFLSSEINSAFFDILGQSMKAPQSISPKQYFESLLPSSRLYWEFPGTSLLLADGGPGPGFHFVTDQIEHTLPSHMPAIPEARFRVAFIPFTGGPPLMKYLTEQQLNLSISVSIPADNPELLERELVDRLSAQTYFINFAGFVMRYLLADYKKTFEDAILGYKNLDLEIELTRNEADLQIMDADILSNRLKIRISLPLDLKIDGRGVTGPSSKSRINDLLSKAIHAYQDRYR